jgi:hypothetical protein
MPDHKNETVAELLASMLKKTLFVAINHVAAPAAAMMKSADRSRAISPFAIAALDRPCASAQWVAGIGGIISPEGLEPIAKSFRGAAGPPFLIPYPTSNSSIECYGTRPQIRFV